MYQPANATLFVVGDVTAEAILPQLEAQFGSWKGTGAAARRPVPQATQLAQGQITIVDMPGAEQSQIRIGWVGVPRSTPDYFTLEVLNTVLGGSFTSRLNQNLREEHQYSYGASSRFDMRLSAGPFQAGAGVQTDKTAEAIREFFNELNGISKPVGADELAKAKNYIALSFPSEFETIGDLSSHMEELVVYDLPDRYFGAVRGQHPGGHLGGGAEGRGDIHPAEALRGRGRRGSQGHRAWHPRAEPRPGARDVG